MSRATASDSDTRQTPARRKPGSVAYSLIQRVAQQRELTVVLVTMFVIIYFGTVNSDFYTTANIVTICQYLASFAVIGFGEVLILSLGEIDLSAGAVYLSSPWFMYFFWSNGMPIGWAIVASMVCCAVIGMINGLITVWLNVSSLIVTLAVNYALFGIVLIGSNDIQVDIPGQTGHFSVIFGVGAWSTTLWATAIMLAFWVLLKRTRFGLHVTATGGNLLAAAESGIRVRRVKVWCFIIISSASGLIGILDAIRIGTANPGSSGLDTVLPGIVAAVVGGTALTGGRGTIFGAAIGAIFLGVLEDGFNLIGINANWFYLAEGIMILVAMIANNQLSTLARKLRR